MGAQELHRESECSQHPAAARFYLGVRHSLTIDAATGCRNREECAMVAGVGDGESRSPALAM
jgi:hypothetical protein